MWTSNRSLKTRNLNHRLAELALLADNSSDKQGNMI